MDKYDEKYADIQIQTLFEILMRKYGVDFEIKKCVLPTDQSWLVHKINNLSNLFTATL